MKHIYDFGSKTDEEVKNDVLIQLYKTGRIDGNYFGVKSKSKENPIKGYINTFLSRNNLYHLDFCEECYQLTFQHLWNKSPEKIVEIVKESPNKLTATALRIVINQCFAIKPNSKSSGLFHNILEKSGYDQHNIVIESAEINNKSDDQDEGQQHIETVIIYDCDLEPEFNELYGFSVEDIIERMTEADKTLFYKQLNKQSVGRPSAQTVEQRKELYARINEIKKQIDKDNEENR